MDLSLTAMTDGTTFFFVRVREQGSGPWDLEVQVVGPKGSEITPFKGIDSKRKTLKIPVPDSVNQVGGTFEIDLGEW